MKQNPQDRRAIKRMLRERERRELLDRLPIPIELLRDLVGYLDEQFESQIQACDDTTAISQSWLSARGIDSEPTLEWLKDVGGFCDCEIVANLTGHFLLSDLFE